MQALRQNKHFLIIGIVLSMVIWGISWPSAKVLSAYGKPLEIAFIRFIFTFFGLLIMLKFLRIPLHVQKKGYRSLLVASILIALYSMLFFNGILKGMPGAGGVLVTTMTPIVSYMLALLVQKRMPGKRELAGLGIGLVAGAVLLHIWNQAGSILDSGNLYFILSTLVWAVLSRITAASPAYGSPLAFSLWMYLLCILVLFFCIDPSAILRIFYYGDSRFWINMIFNGVINTGVATTFFFYATSKMGAERTSSFIYIVPFAAALSSFIALGEQIAWNTIAGGLLGIAAVWIINMKRKRATERAA